MIAVVLLVVAFGVAAFLLGTTLYVGGSYLLAHRHAPRAFGAAARDAARELGWTLVVQPLLPLYWLFGRRMGGLRLARPGQGGRRPVIFVHGYAQNRVDFVLLARTLRRRGLHDLYGFNYAWVAKLETSAAKLADFVETVRAECGAEQVDLVCHSMGGLVALQYLQDEAAARHVARCVAIASPFGGVPWRGPLLGRAAVALRKGFPFPEGPPVTLPIRMLSVYSRHDNVVHPSATSSLARWGGRDLEAGTMGHLAILFDRRVAEAVADFLLDEDANARTELVVEPEP